MEIEDIEDTGTEAMQMERLRKIMGKQSLAGL